MRSGMRRGLSGGAVLGLVLATTAARGQEKGGAGMDLIELTNGTVVVGVLPPLGGRVVLLKTAGGENLLDSDPRFWKPPYPQPAIETPFTPVERPHRVGRAADRLLVAAGPESRPEEPASRVAS